MESTNEEGTVLPLIISQTEITVNQGKKEYTGGSLPKVLMGSKQLL